MNKIKKTGLDMCVEAFERLKAGNPRVLKHVGLSRSKFTAGIISYESGQSRGYLKKGRERHKPLIKKIEDYAKGKSSLEEQLEQTKAKSNKKLREEQKKISITEELFHQALSRELLLVAKIKELEQKVKNL
jgi:hypothetical protein